MFIDDLEVNVAGSRGKPFDLVKELLESFDHALRVSEYLVAVVPEEAWRAEPAGGKGRTVAAIAAHMQGVRRTFGKMAAGHEVASGIERLTSTPEEAASALRESREALVRVLGGAVARGEGRIKGLPRRVVNMIFYLTQHDAHHRGQITRQVRELGHEMPEKSVTIIWGWRKLP